MLIVQNDNPKGIILDDRSKVSDSKGLVCVWFVV